MTTKEVFFALAPDYGPKNDPWGQAVSAFFDVAGELTKRGADVPDAWQYRPGAGGPSVSEWGAEVFADLQPTDADLLRLGALLHKLTDRLDRAGRSY